MAMTDAQAAAFLESRFHGEASALRSVGKGEWSKAYIFERSGVEYVIRFSALAEDFAKDRLAASFNTPIFRPGRYAAQHLSAPGGARDGGDAVLRGETGDQTDQESRSAGHRAAHRMTAMDITIHASFLPHNDPDAFPAFYRDTLGFEVRSDVGYEGMRRIMVGPAGQPGTSIVLHPPAAAPGITDDERRTIVELAGHSDRDNAERDGKRASLFMAGVRRPLRGSLASSVLATVRPLSSPEVKRLDLVRRTEGLRNG